jgi:putative FmdB family regulatory protein
MPIYEYQCESCERRTEAIQRLDEPPLTICPHCGGPLVKLMSAPAFQFKGWYVTDYAGKGDGAKKEAKEGGEGEAAPASGGEAKAGTKGGEAKAGTKGGEASAKRTSESSSSTS